VEEVVVVVAVMEVLAAAAAVVLLKLFHPYSVTASTKITPSLLETVAQLYQISMVIME
jgi:hypothetical protein